MKVYGKYLLYSQNRDGIRGIVTSDMKKQNLLDILEYNAKQIEKNLWTVNNEMFFWIEKNTKEYR